MRHLQRESDAVERRLFELGISPEQLPLNDVLQECAKLYKGDSQKSYAHLLEIFLQTVIVKIMKVIQNVTIATPNTVGDNIIIKKNEAHPHVSRLAILWNLEWEHCSVCL